MTLSAARVPRTVESMTSPAAARRLPAVDGQLLGSPAADDIVVVLVTHNRPELLAESLAALQAQCLQPRRVVVVDNASDEQTRAILAASPVDVVRSEVNLGGAGGFATGIRRAMELGAEWIWLMDDDAIPASTALDALQSEMARLPATTGAVCSCVMEFGSIATTHRRRFNPLLGYERAYSCADYGSAALRIDTASFVGFMVSAAAVRAVGLPDADFFLSYDDTEYSLRLGKHGFGVWLVPASVIVHKRNRAGRLRATEFGPKHYFNVRNRMVVKRAYCRAGSLGAAAGALFGLALWLRSPRRFALQPWRMLLAAISDGMAGRLGPLPERLQPGAVR